MTELIIDLTLLRSNFETLRKQIQPETKIIAVVKANAYGLGSIEIGKTLLDLGADWLAVAYANEGIALREAGIDAPIMVFYPQFEHLNLLIKYQLEPVLYSPEILKAFIKHLSIKEIESYPVHLKCNTGLNRIGFKPNEITRFFTNEKASPLTIRTVYSHLGASENAKPCSFTQQQINCFLEVKKSVEALAKTPPLFHLLNTSGVFNYPELQMNVVRAGIGLYGFANRAVWNKALIPIATLRSRIVQIHSLKKGENVGYNLGFTATKPTRIAVISIGHADGITRRYGNGKGKIFVHGKPAPIVGNVCMDMLMIDVTEIQCDVQDQVTLFDQTQRADTLAEDAGTIAYELLTGLSERIPRTYY